MNNILKIFRKYIAYIVEMLINNYVNLRLFLIACERFLRSILQSDCGLAVAMWFIAEYGYESAIYHFCDT